MSGQLPNCTCGAQNWQGGGAQMGPGYHFFGRTCGTCNNHLLYVAREGYWVALVFPSEMETQAVEYANTSLAVQARAFKAKWEPVAQARSKDLFESLCREWGLDPEKGVTHHYLEGVTYTHTYPASGRSVELTDFEYRDNEGNRLDIDAHAFYEAGRRLWDANPEKPTCVRAPDPVNIPDGVTAFVLRPEHDGGTDVKWERVTPKTGSVAALLGEEQVVDPLRQRHDAWWAEIFKRVREATGTDFTPTEIPNRYFNDRTNAQPWYEFKVRNTDFVVGPRKRVDSIQIRCPHLLHLAALRDIAKADQVTYDVDGSWQSGVDEGRSVEVHAWTKDKAVEYLTLAVRAALG